MKGIRGSNLARFWRMIDRRGEDDCWVWRGRLNQHGYGVFNQWHNGKRSRTIVASRYALQLHLGRALNEGEMACHRCDNRPCVNPNHLFLGSARDNIQDAVAKGRTHKWDGQRSGSDNPRAKLTEADVRKIKGLLRDGARTTDIAAQFKVAVTTICEIKSGRNWGHVLVDPTTLQQEAMAQHE